MSEPTFDAQGNLHLGPFSDNRKARLTIDFSPDESDGIALDVKEASGSASARAVIKLGDFTIGQDVSKTGAAVFGVKDADGVVLATFSPGVAGGDLATRVKYMDAAATATLFHMEADTSLDALAALAEPDSQANANARANALKAHFATHAASVGTRAADGAHLAADTGNAATLAAVADASDLATSITLVNALLVAYAAHGAQAGVHFHDDATLAAAAITTDPPVTLTNVCVDLNDLLDLMVAHADNGAA